MDALATLPRLAWAELRLNDGVAGGQLQARLAANGGRLVAHTSRVKANALAGAAGKALAGAAALEVQPPGGGFVLTAAPTFHLLASRLESIRWVWGGG